MRFSYNWLKDYIVGKMPEPKRLADLLMSRSFEIDSLEKKGKDWVLDIKVLSNRAADCLSHMGIAREISAVASRKLKDLPLNFVASRKNKASDFIEVQIENKKDCPRYTVSVITGIKVGQSPKWLQDRLVACGLQAINNIVDITNYVMLETGQPLHAFDADKIGAKSEFSIFNFQFSNKSKIQKKKIIIRRARKGETIKTLDKEKGVIGLDQSILVIADNRQGEALSRPIAIAGIKGGAETGIDESTKNVIIEAANFNPVLIRRGSQKLKIRTDASWRFENGLDANLIDFAQKRACYLIQQIAKGEITNGLADVSALLAKSKKIQLNLTYLKSLLGAEVSKTVIIKILKSLGCKIIKKTVNNLLVEPPTYRLDLKTQEDLIEEISRVWGYEKVPRTFPAVALNVPLKNKDLFFENKAKDILVGLGFCEAYNYTFIGEKEKATFGYSDEELLEIANPVSELNKFLRPCLTVHLLKNAKENLKNFSEIKMFEIGKVFSKKPAQQERLHLGLVAAGKKQGSELFFEVKGVLETMLSELEIKNISFIESESQLSSADIFVSDKIIGTLRHIGPSLLEKLGIKEKVVLGEIDFQQVLGLASEQKKYQPISPYPASLRDIAMLVPQEEKAAVVLEKVKQAGGKLLVEVELFDIYSGPGLPAGKKNLAFHLTYQSNQKTLSAEEVEETQQRIFSIIEKQGWQVRK